MSNNKQRQDKELVEKFGIKCQWCKERPADRSAHLHSKLAIKMVNDQLIKTNPNSSSVYVNTDTGYVNKQQGDMTAVGITCKVCDDKLAKKFEQDDDIDTYLLVTLWKYIALGIYEIDVGKDTILESPRELLVESREEIKRRLDNNIKGYSGQFHDWKKVIVEEKEGKLLDARTLLSASVSDNYHGDKKFESAVVQVCQHYGFWTITPATPQEISIIKLRLSSFSNYRDILQEWNPYEGFIKNIKEQQDDNK